METKTGEKKERFIMVTRVKNEDDMKKKELAKQEAEVVSHVFEYISCFHIFFRLYSYCLPFMKFLFTFFSACIPTLYNRQC